MKDINGHISNNLITTDIGLLCNDCVVKLTEQRQQEVENGIMDATEAFWEPRTEKYIGR